MIKVKTFQKELAFNNHQTTVYFEVVGEGNPVLTRFDDFHRGSSDIHTYEYLWTLCTTSDTDWVKGIDCFKIQLYFQSKNLRIREFSCNLFKVGTNRLSPVQRLAAATSNFGLKISGVEVQTGNLISGIFEGISKANKAWYNKQYTTREYCQGIEWFVPSGIYEDYGNRIFGSCQVSFYETGAGIGAQDGNSLGIGVYREKDSKTEMIFEGKAFDILPAGPAV